MPKRSRSSRWRAEIANHSKDDYSTDVTVYCSLPNDYLMNLESIAQSNGEDLKVTLTRCLFFGCSSEIKKFLKIKGDK